MINDLKRKHNRENYQISRSISDDYAYYRDNDRIPQGYRPGFVSDFYEKEKIPQ